MHFKFKDGSFDFSSKRCILFGILNVTPDSFSDGGQFTSVESAFQHGLRLEQEGADVLDIGGESTRPGAQPVSTEEELKRILPIIRALKKKVKIPFSIDTTKSAVAEAALLEGAKIINDISGLRADPQMASIIASSGAGVIIMHSRGAPSTMQTLCEYQNVVEDVKNELLKQVQYALDGGISADHIAIDPGIGFAKTKDQNLILLKNLKSFTSLQYPVMIGVSRKSFLGGEVKDRGAKTLAAEMEAYHQGVRMIRTHDIAAIRKSLKL